MTAQEHAEIIASEKNPEKRAYYELLYETSGGAHVIYPYIAEHNAIVLATLYKKSKRETLTEDEKQSLKQAANTIKARFKLG